MLLQKEKLPKAAGRHESSFTDDGFALGLAYILRILDQNDAFNGLHWFESVNNHIGTRRTEGVTLRANIEKGKLEPKVNRAAAAAAHAKNEEDLLQHAVTMKKLTNVQMEFDLFFYSFSGATIFFQDVVTSVNSGHTRSPAHGQQRSKQPRPAQCACVRGSSRLIAACVCSSLLRVAFSRPLARSAPGATGVDGKQEEKKDDSAGAPAADASGVPAAPDMAASSIPVPPPMDGVPSAPPMMAAADGMVVGVGAPPPPPPDF